MLSISAENANSNTRTCTGIIIFDWLLVRDSEQGAISGIQFHDSDTSAPVTMGRIRIFLLNVSQKEVQNEVDINLHLIHRKFPTIQIKNSSRDQYKFDSCHICVYYIKLNGADFIWVIALSATDSSLFRVSHY